MICWPLGRCAELVEVYLRFFSEFLVGLNEKI